MIPPLVKICGLSEPATLDAAVGAGATHVGFVFFPPSPRTLAPAAAAALAARVPDTVAKVGVFVDPDDALLAAAIAAARLDAVQLHGSESPERLAEVRQRHGVAVWKGVGVRTRPEIEAAVARFRGAADRLLLDAKAPSGSTLPGGNGVRFDWRLLADARPAMPWGLSGGLDADNVAEAASLTGAPLLDASSGVEDAPGVKSARKIRRFVEVARGRR